METSDIIKFVSDGFEKAKEGNAAEVYSSVSRYHEDGSLPLKSHYPFGWIIYYALHQSPSSAIKERKLMLARYLKLQVEKPHKLHSMILTEAIRLYKEAADAASLFKTEGFKPVTDATRFSIVKFSELWNLDNLRPGDWTRKTYEGKRLPSTVEKLITAYVDEHYASNQPASPEFLKIIDRALAEFPRTANLYAQRAQLYELEGNKEAAIGMLKNALRASSSKYYLWSRLAALITDKDSLRLRVSLLCKALSCPGQEQFKGKIHMNLAVALAEGGAFPQAKWELKYVKDLYEKKDWRLPRPYNETMKKLPTGTKVSDPGPIYRKLAHLAEEFIFQ